MDIPTVRKFPLSFVIYDLFGYLLPGLAFGALTLLSCDILRTIQLVEKYIKRESLDLNSLYTISNFINFLHRSPIFISILGLIFAYIIGHVIASFSSLILERWVVEPLLGYPTCNLFNLKKKSWCVRWLFFMKYLKPYSEEFINAFRNEFENQFKLKLKHESDIFWMTFEFVAQNCPVAFSRVSHFLSLYGFSRNLSMVFLLSGLILIDNISNHPIYKYAILSYFAIAYFLFLNYLKLLRRLNDETYRAFLSYIATYKVQLKSNDL